MVSGWDRRSRLVDPCAGSGTLGIEAALLATAAAPGRLRGFALFDTPLFHGATWEAVKADASRGTSVPPDLHMHLRDRDAATLGSAEVNVSAAGFRHLIDLEVGALGRLRPPGDPWFLISNPPHGRRLGSSPDLLKLYRALAAKCAGASGVALLVSDRDLARRSGLGLRTALTTKSGGAPVHVLARGDK